MRDPWDRGFGALAREDQLARGRATSRAAVGASGPRAQYPSRNGMGETGVWCYGGGMCPLCFSFLLVSFFRIDAVLLGDVLVGDVVDVCTRCWWLAGWLHVMADPDVDCQLLQKMGVKVTGVEMAKGGRRFFQSLEHRERESKRESTRGTSREGGTMRVHVFVTAWRCCLVQPASGLTMQERVPCHGL